MHTILGRNVNSLFAYGVRLLASEGRLEESRNGPVIVMPTPVTSVYERPCERVLFSRRRRANPFFHLLESLWMLAGRDDAASLDHYVRDFGARFAEPDGVIHGAYGRRWRGALGHDQLDAVVQKLRTSPQDRQAVIQIWDATGPHEMMGHPDLGEEVYFGCDDLLGEWRDRPCNTHVYLRVRREPIEPFVDSSMGVTVPIYSLLLDLTVSCRSNDIVWGAYGANAVHFSMLLEYLAGRIGVGVGRMYQVSNNYHGYVGALDRLGEPEELALEPDYYEQNGGAARVKCLPIGEHWEDWDADLDQFMAWHDHLWTLSPDSSNIDLSDGIRNTWFYTVPAIMVQCYWLRRSGRGEEATAHAAHVEADDWRAACLTWLGDHDA